MRILNVNFWTVKKDGTYILYCEDERLGTEYSVKIPSKFSDIIDFKQLKEGKLKLPKDYSLTISA